MWQHANRGRKECVGETVFGPNGQGKIEGYGTNTMLSVYKLAGTRMQ
jgi:hypothetical protein